MGHGGRRQGAGRRQVKLSRSGKVNKATAEDILGQESNEIDAWLCLLNATTTVSVVVIGGESGQRETITVPDNRIRLEARKYLTDKRDGKAPQAVSFSGSDGGVPAFRVLIEHIGQPFNSSSAKTN